MTWLAAPIVTLASLERSHMVVGGTFAESEAGNWPASSVAVTLARRERGLADLRAAIVRPDGPD